MDYIAFCRQLYATTGIPTVLYQDGVLRYSALAELLGVEPQGSWPVYDPDRNPEFAAINPDLEYGMYGSRGEASTCFWGRSLPRRSPTSCCTSILKKQKRLLPIRRLWRS